MHLGFFAFHALENLVNFFLAQWHRSLQIAGTDKPGDARRIANGIPNFVRRRVALVQFHHFDENVSRKDTPLNVFALAFADFNFPLDGHDDTENTVLQAHRVDPLFETLFDFVLVARIAMDNIPDASNRLFLFFRSLLRLR